MKHIILGAGPIGVVLQQQLSEAGHDVRLYNIMNNPAYKMPGTQPQTIDGTNHEQVLQVCEGADVIYLCLNAHYVDWYDLFPPRLNTAIAVATKTRARLIYHDTTYVYGSVDGTITEDTPYTRRTRKGKLRAEMAQQMIDVIRSGTITGAVARTADIYGAGALNSSFNSTLGQRHFEPLLSGKSVRVLGNIQQPHTYAYVDDVARDLITLAMHDKALGEVWHLPAAPTLTHRELLEIAFDIVGLPPKINGSVVSGYFVRFFGRFQRDLGEVAELTFMFDKPYVVSHQKFEQVFGSEPTPHRVALKKTLEWYKQHLVSS